MKKIVVLGSNSFSGSHFVDLLLNEGDWEVVGVSRSKEKSKIKNQNFRFAQIDLNSQRKKLFELFDDFRPEYIINFAGLVEVSSSWNYPEHYFQTNCFAIVSLANFLKEKKYLKRYVHISTPEVYGTTIGRAKEDTKLNPSTPYAASKAAVDLYLMTINKNYNFPVIFIRSTNVYGPGQQAFRIIPKTIISIKKKIKIPLEGGGRAIKSYIHIKDVSHGELIALLKGKDGEIYHISPDRSISIRDLVRMICEKMGVSFKNSANIASDRLGQDKAYVLDSSKIRHLGWMPEITLEKGIDEVVEWVNQNWDKLSKEPLIYRHRF